MSHESNIAQPVCTNTNTVSGTGNSSYPAHFTIINNVDQGTYHALQECTRIACAGGITPSQPHPYYSIDLHYSTDTDSFVCRQYNGQLQVRDFNVQDGNAIFTYGYNVALGSYYYGEKSPL